MSVSSKCDTSLSTDLVTGKYVRPSSSSLNECESADVSPEYAAAWPRHTQDQGCSMRNEAGPSWVVCDAQAGKKFKLEVNVGFVQ